MSEELDKTLQEEETVVPNEEVTVSDETETSADTVSVEKEVEVVETDQASEEPETSTDEPAEGTDDAEHAEVEVEQTTEETVDAEGSDAGVTPELEQTEDSDSAEDAEKSEETAEDTEASQNGDVSFMDYIDSMQTVKKGAIIKGTIIRYDDEYAYVDVKDKSEGKIPMDEFEKDPEFDLELAIADRREIDVFVKNVRSTDAGKDIQLSKARVDYTKHKDAVKEFHEKQEPVVVRVHKQVKDGLIASYGSVDIYIHRTQMENKTLSDADMAEYVGNDVEILVTQFDSSGRRLRVSGSRRTLINLVRKERAEDLWESIAVGDIYEGVVRNITNFGAFVDLGGVDGLVHVSELSWDHIKHASEVVAVGDVIQVYVKDFDQEKNRISLGYKRIEDDPYHNVEEKFPVGSIIQGKVVRILNFGAFVEIADGVDALCHISEISDLHLDKPSDVLEVGQEVTARVLEVSNERRRVSISIKAVEPINELRGEAAEKAKAREEQEAKRNANRVPRSFTDSTSEDAAPSDMELAFAAAQAKTEGAEDVVDTEEDAVVADVETDVEETEVEADVETDVEETEVDADVEADVEETETEEEL